MSDSSRIDDLRRRLQKDPASIAFAQLAEELRRAGSFKEAVDVCRAGLRKHPGYVSARVTLGRALIELKDLDGAERELEAVIKAAPDNLSAMRSLGDLSRRRGDLHAALAQYQLALALARNDPDLERIVDELSRQLGSGAAAPKEKVAAPAKIARPVVGPTPVPKVGQPASRKPDPIRERALLTIAALERFLDAVHVVRTEHRA